MTNNDRKNQSGILLEFDEYQKIVFSYLSAYVIVVQDISIVAHLYKNLSEI